MKDIRSSKPLGFRGVAMIATEIGAVAVGDPSRLGRERRIQKRLPAANNRSTSQRSGVMYERNVDRLSVPSRTRCHQANIWCACLSKASPISSALPPRSRMHHGR